MSNAQLREQAEFEVQAAQARSNTEVREMAQKLEAIEQTRQRELQDLQTALRQETAAEAIAQQQSQRWNQELQQVRQDFTVRQTTTANTSSGVAALC